MTGSLVMSSCYCMTTAQVRQSSYWLNQCMNQGLHNSSWCQTQVVQKLVVECGLSQDFFIQDSVTSAEAVSVHNSSAYVTAWSLLSSALAC